MGRKTCGAGLVALVLAGAGPAAAQRVTFEPSVFFGATYTDNVAYADEAERSDRAALISLDLPVSRETQRTRLRFGYRPSYQQHRDEEALDRDEHRLRFEVESDVSQRAELIFAAGFSRTQEQGRGRELDGDDLEDADVTLTERTERDEVRAHVTLNFRQTQLWNWALEAGWADRSHDRISGFDTTVDDSDVEDRTEHRGIARISRQTGRRTRIGLRAEHRRFDLQVSGDETSDLASLTFDADVRDNLDLHLALGGFRSEGDPRMPGEPETERNGVQGRFDLVRTFRRARLGLDVEHGPTAGGHLEGTSTDTGIRAYISGVGSERWRWNAGPRYTHRDPSDPTRETRKTLGFVGRVERRVVPELSISLGGAWVDETTDSPDVPDRTVGSVDLGIVWYPRGRGGRKG